MFSVPALRGFDQDVTKSAFKIAVRPDQVDDFEQEGMIAAHRAFNRYKGKLQGLELRKAMMRSATNAMKSWQRKLIRMESAVHFAKGVEAAAVQEPSGDRGVKELADKAIETLVSDDQMRCAKLYCEYLGDVSVTEVSKEVGCSRATASRAVSGFKSEFQSLWDADQTKHGTQEALHSL